MPKKRNLFFISRVNTVTQKAIKERIKNLKLDSQREYLGHLLEKDGVLIEDQSI